MRLVLKIDKRSSTLSYFTPLLNDVNLTTVCINPGCLDTGPKTT